MGTSKDKLEWAFKLLSLASFLWSFHYCWVTLDEQSTIQNTSLSTYDSDSVFNLEPQRANLFFAIDLSGSMMTDVVDNSEYERYSTILQTINRYYGNIVTLMPRGNFKEFDIAKAKLFEMILYLKDKYCTDYLLNNNNEYYFTLWQIAEITAPIIQNDQSLLRVNQDNLRLAVISINELQGGFNGGSYLNYFNQMLYHYSNELNKNIKTDIYSNIFTIVGDFENEPTRELHDYDTVVNDIERRNVVLRCFDVRVDSIVDNSRIRNSMRTIFPAYRYKWYSVDEQTMHKNNELDLDLPLISWTGS